MNDDEYQALVDSIRASGLHDPIITLATEDGDQILDGVHR